MDDSERPIRGVEVAPQIIELINRVRPIRLAPEGSIMDEIFCHPEKARAEPGSAARRGLSSQE